MIGCVSEESNEAFNGTLKETKCILNKMSCVDQRIKKINERGQANLKGEVLNNQLAIYKTITGKKRGPYKARVQCQDGRILETGSLEIRQIDGEQYVVLPCGSLLREEWALFYDWFSGGKAPKDWLERLDKTAPARFTDFDRVMEVNSKLV